MNKYLIISIALFYFFIACKSYKNLRRRQSAISFHSVYENDTLNVKVNDSMLFKNHKIDMIFEWGISKNTTVYITGNEFKIIGSFRTTEIVDKELNLEISRTLEFDTILKAKNGRYIDISANRKKVIIVQSKKIKIVE
jgi:predicted transcriptional regulator